MGKDSWVLFLAKKQGRIVGALSTFIFRHRLGTSLNSIPYPGPMGGIATDISKDHASTIYEILLGHLVAFGRQNNIDLLTTITSPFQNDIYLYERYLNPTHILKNFTQYVDLKNPLRFSHGIRQRIRKTDSSSYQIWEDDKISIIKQWWLIYRLRMRELGVRPIPLQFFLSIRENLAPKNARFFFINVEEKLVGGCVYIFHRDILDVYMLSCLSRYNSLSPATLLTYQTIAWARKKGFRIYNFQSSKRRGDGVYQFKAQWGAVEAPYYFVTKVLHKAKLEGMLDVPFERITTGYRWHYLLPYYMWGLVDKPV